MDGTRKGNTSVIERTDPMAPTEDSAKVSGIPYVMDAYQEEAERISH
jgi:hypothetical protein